MLLIRYFYTESVLIAIFFIINEDKYFRESATSSRYKLQSYRCAAVWSNFQSWVLDMHKVWTARTNKEYSICQIRIRIRDLFVAAVATTYRQCHLE